MLKGATISPSSVDVINFQETISQTYVPLEISGVLRNSLEISMTVLTTNLEIYLDARVQLLQSHLPVDRL
jgi:hypothetical protein